VTLIEVILVMVILVHQEHSNKVLDLHMDHNRHNNQLRQGLHLTVIVKHQLF
jgi:hypothetical protein